MLGTSSSVSYKFELFSPLQDFQRNLGDSSLAEQRPKLNDRVNVVAKYILDSIFSFLLAPKEALIFGIELKWIERHCNIVAIKMNGKNET